MGAGGRAGGGISFGGEHHQAVEAVTLIMSPVLISCSQCSKHGLSYHMMALTTSGCVIKQDISCGRGAVTLIMSPVLMSSISSSMCATNPGSSSSCSNPCNTEHAPSAPHSPPPRQKTTGHGRGQTKPAGRAHCSNGRCGVQWARERRCGVQWGGRGVTIFLASSASSA